MYVCTLSNISVCVIAYGCIYCLLSIKPLTHLGCHTIGTQWGRGELPLKLKHPWPTRPYKCLSIYCTHTPYYHIINVQPTCTVNYCVRSVQYGIYCTGGAFDLPTQVTIKQLKLANSYFSLKYSLIILCAYASGHLFIHRCYC